MLLVVELEVNVIAVLMLLDETLLDEDLFLTLVIIVGRLTGLICLAKIHRTKVTMIGPRISATGKDK